MTFRTESLGQHFKLQKGLSYKGEYLSDESELGLIGLDSFVLGGGYKSESEKPYSGPFKQEHSAQPGDVLLAMTEQQDGLLASPLVIPEHLGGYESLIFSHHVAKVVTTSERLRPEFLYNFLRVPLNRARAAYGNTGTTVQDLPYDVIYEQEIPVPTLEEQDRINSFVAVIDRKIELNTAMAENLEKIAQSFFRSWFIDFDPVRAKMAGEKPVGMDDETAALFPESMEDSEFGAIPSGWTASTVGEFAPFVYGKALKADSRQGGTVPVYGSSGVVGFHNYSLTDSSAVIIGRKGTVGTVNLCLQPAWIIDTGYFSIPADVSDIYLVFFSLKVLGLQKMNSDAAVPGLNRDEAHRQEIVVGDVAIRKRFSEIAGLLFTKIKSLQNQSWFLVETRDRLLPRLISGELQIPEEMVMM